MTATLTDSASVLDLLRERGLRVPDSRRCDDVEAAVTAATELRAPFVLKAGGLLHKTDDGGVVLGLADAEAVRVAACELTARLGTAALPLLVQEMATGLELLVGARRDPELGVTVTVGLGGTATEVHRDLVTERAPVDPAGAARMLAGLRSWPLLSGFRGAAPLDVDAACEAVAVVSALALDDPDVGEVEVNPLMVSTAGGGATAVDARILPARTAGPRPPKPSRPRDLHRLMAPEHVVVVGVSDDEHKVGRRLFRYLRSHGYAGRLDAVHPQGGTVDGLPRHASLAEVPGSPDLVCVTVPSRYVLPVAHDAVRAGAGALLVHSSDFAESGEEGRALQDELATVCAAGGVALVGPNDMGVVVPGLGLTASISGGLEHGLRAGPVALLTSSGALGSCLATRLMGSGVGLSSWVHVGNEADLTLADFLHHAAGDETTRSAVLLLEDLKDGDAFVDAGRAMAAAGKPVFAYSMVRSDQGRQAAMSHTGAMVGSFEARQAVLRAAGVVPVGSLRELEDAVTLAASAPLPAGDRVMAVTFSGGACSIIADEAVGTPVRLPDLSETTREAVRPLVPSYSAVRNPFDLSFQMLTRDDDFERALEILGSGTDFDALLVQLTTNADPYAARLAERIVAVRERLSVPLYVSRYGGEHLAPRALAVYAEHGVPVLDAPDRALRAVAHLVSAGQETR